MSQGPWGLQAPLVPFPRVLRGPLSPTARSPNFKARATRAQPLRELQWCPLSKRLCGLTPSPISSRTAGSERNLPAAPPLRTPLGGACGVVAPLNVTYCLRVDLGSAKLPSNSPAPQVKQKKGCSFGTFPPLISFSYLLRLSSGVVFKTTSPLSQSEAGAHPRP